MSYLYETHVHTSDVSPCGEATAEEMVKRYKNAGYSGMMITDHFGPWYLEKKYPGNSWKEKVDYFIRGYENAKKSETDDFSVMFGMEMRLSDTDNDYLIFGLTEKFLYDHSEMPYLELHEFHKFCQKNNLTVIQAHPFRQSQTIVEITDIDGIEAYNACLHHDSRNDIAKMWAEKYNLRPTSGSDAHRTEDAARGGIFTGKKVKTSEELMQVILSGDYKLKTLPGTQY